MIKCNNCGSKNQDTNSFCGNCGSQIKKNHTKASKNKSAKNSVGKEGSAKSVLSNKLIFYSFFILALLGAFLLYSSGVFNKPSFRGKPPIQKQTSFNNGVNLSANDEINKLETIVNQNPKDYNSLLRLAHLLNDNKFYDRSIVKYKSYLAAFPNTPDVLVDLGVVYFDLKDYQNATSYMQKAISISPKHQKANFNMGIINYVQQNVTEAVKWWQKAIDIDPLSDVGIRAKNLIKNIKI